MSSTVLSRVKGAKRWAKQTFGFKFKDCDVELKKVQPSSSAPSLYVSYKGKQRKLTAVHPQNGRQQNSQLC